MVISNFSGCTTTLCVSSTQRKQQLPKTLQTFIIMLQELFKHTQIRQHTRKHKTEGKAAETKSSIPIWWVTQAHTCTLAHPKRSALGPFQSEDKGTSFTAKRWTRVKLDSEHFPETINAWEKATRHAVLQWNAKFFYNSSTHENILTIPTVDKLKHKWLYLQSLLKRHKDCWPIFPFVQKQGSATESRSVSQCALESSQGWTPGSGVHFHEKQAAVCCKIIAVFAFVSQTFHRVFKRTISEQLSNQIKSDILCHMHIQ